MKRTRAITRTRWPRCDEIVVRGRRFTQGDLVLMRGLMRRHPNWGRTLLSVRVCEALDWRQQNGRPKDRACRVALLRLERMGFLQLPERKVDRGGRPPIGDRPIQAALPSVRLMPEQILLTRVSERRDSRTWNALVSRYHYLGLGTPVGRLVRYLIYGDGDLLGGISFSECAWSLDSRNYALEAMGIMHTDWRQVVINNNRFLILPTVAVPNLASRILSTALRQVQRDWAALFGPEPLVAETFVDPAKYSGICYRAANWLLAGTTRGFSKRGARHLAGNGPKLILLRGLTAQVHRRLEHAVKGYSQRAA